MDARNWKSCLQVVRKTTCSAIQDWKVTIEHLCGSPDVFIESSMTVLHEGSEIDGSCSEKEASVPKSLYISD